MKIGLIREGKIPTDTRVALSPEQCNTVLTSFPEISLKVQPAENRSFTNEEYEQQSITISEDVSDAEVLLGIKEVPIKDLIADKTYFFFSHTKKKQPYNQKLMQALIEKRIRMIDYEALTFYNGKRIIGFGFFAGVVGAHNALLTFGKKEQLFSLIPAHQCKDMEEMKAQYQHINIPAIKVVVTGDGRVAQGIVHIMEAMNITEVSAEDYINKTFEGPVYTRLKNEDLYQNKETKTYDKSEFYKNPSLYESKFHPFLQSDILINGIYWDLKIPRLFEKTDLKQEDFSIKVIADVTCDEDGSVPINIGSSSILDPVYGYDKNTGTKASPFLKEDHIVDIMAVDNLPNELPRDASRVFGEHIINHIIPELLKERSDILDRATICDKGKLSPYFSYLEDYAFPKA